MAVVNGHTMRPSETARERRLRAARVLRGGAIEDPPSLERLPPWGWWRRRGAELEGDTTCRYQRLTARLLECYAKAVRCPVAIMAVGAGEPPRSHWPAALFDGPRRSPQPVAV